MAFLIDIAKYLPGKLIKNEDLVQFPEKYRDMIFEKAGICSRYHVTDECTSDIGAKAVQKLLEKTQIDPKSVESLICATSSPDRVQPATATRIQVLCGLSSAFSFDVNSVCSGGIFALKLASALVNDGIRNVIVVGAEVYSKILNPKDISTFPYFGDGAAAALISNKGDYELSAFILGSDGSGADVINIPGGGTMLPAARVEREKDRYFTMNGSEVFKFACAKGSEVVKNLLLQTKITPDRVISHQANINILKNIAATTDIPFERFFINLDRYANTAGASCLIALSENLEINSEDKNIFMLAFGGGLSWGGCYLKKYYLKSPYPG